VPPRPSIPTDDLYARLEVPPDASFEAIEIAWRALLKRHHPDVAGHETLELAKRINVAHDWLSSPALRERYDRERRGATGSVRSTAWHARSSAPIRPAPTDARPVRRPPADPAAAVRRFVDRVGRLSRDELDRLSLADTTSIAFVASIHRFLNARQIAALEAVERDVRRQLPAAAWANAPTRDAVLAAAHELVLAPFLDEHLSEPFRGRARDRLMRGWEAAVDQRRYGPNTAGVERFVERAGTLDEPALRTLVDAAGRVRLGDDPWPPGLDPEEDEGLRVSTALAARDAAAAAARPLRGLDAATRARAERLLGRTAHALVLRHAFAAAEFDRLVAPWRAATGDPGTGRASDTRPEPGVRRR
jgi:curved DNA-binding protein CbpA